MVFEQGERFMKRNVFFLCIALLFLTGGSAQYDLKRQPSCPYCGMNRGQYAHSRMLIEYAEKETTGVCSIHCAASEISLNRAKTLVSIRVADYPTRNLIPAEKAFWVIGGNKPGVMTKRAKWAFKEKEHAERFIKLNGGRHAQLQDAMKATFEDMYEDIKMIRERRKARQMNMLDLKTFPESKYCGMFREKFAHSRALIEYDEGTAVGTCSVHCLAIDLALNIDKTPRAIMVADYTSRKLIDAEKAFWVLGGNKTGVMSIRGKWAFEEREESSKFIKGNGGWLADFDEVMRASFQDMYEILR
jgi:nitrous oxide reductase accessory protein NosL